jgi:hypothetical protein
MRNHVMLSVLVLAGCGAVSPEADAGQDSGVSPDAGNDAGYADAGADAGSMVDAGSPDSGADAGVDAGTAMTHPCPATGMGSIIATGGCVVFTPAEAGAAATGENATKQQYALEPVGVAKGALVVEFNGSGGSPSGQIADPTKNLYNAAAQAGFHVLGLAYRSAQIIGAVCANNAGCYEPTRTTVITGTFTTGAAAGLANIRLDEGIVWRLEAALRLLAADRPSAGWDQFLVNPTAADPAQRIAWGKLVASGHSQGGGHAALLGKRYPLRQVLQLSSTCDEVGGTPAPWTTHSGAFMTDPTTKYVGFGSPGDTICPAHVAVWNNLGMPAANQHDDAATCGMNANTHGASITCADNFARWGQLLFP